MCSDFLACGGKSVSNQICKFSTLLTNWTMHGPAPIFLFLILCPVEKTKNHKYLEKIPIL